MFHYFAKDGTRTDDCAEAKTLLRGGSTEPHLWLVRDDAPSPDELYGRLLALLAPMAEVEDMTVLSKEQIFAGDQYPAGSDRPFVVRVANEEESAEARIAAWLATPNPSLGGKTPDELLRGDASGRYRLGHMVGEMEQGAFS